MSFKKFLKKRKSISQRIIHVEEVIENEDDTLSFLSNKITSFFDWVWGESSDSDESDPGIIQNCIL
jgi:hypothetical protein